MKVELPVFAPGSFFEIGVEAKYFDGRKKLGSGFLVPHLLEGLGDFFLGWNENGLWLKFQMPFPYQKCFFPDYRRGDSIEFLLCTRSLASSFFTKYHHHFVFFPEKVEGSFGKEVTRFRLSDLHELAKPELLSIEVKATPKAYTMEVFLPKAALFGFDPANFSQLSFNYIINRYHERSFSFSSSLEEASVEKKPALWSQLWLKK